MNQLDKENAITLQCANIKIFKYSCPKMDLNNT